LGGAIPGDAKVVDVENVTKMEVNVPDQYTAGYFHDLGGVDDLRDRPQILHGIPRIMVEKTLRPMFQSMFEPPYADEFLLRDLKHSIGTVGVDSHHPEVRQVVFDSLSSYPELQEHYLRS
jgi:hypothetical protein